MTQSNLNTTAETEPGYGQLFAVLIRRRFWLLSVFCGVLSAAAILTLIEKPTYESSMQLLIEPTYQGKREQGQQNTQQEQFTDSNVEIDYATQINVMRSPVLLQRVVDLLNPEYPDLNVDELEKLLYLTPILEEQGSNNKVNTKIVKAVYTDNDPIKTKKVLEAVQKIYQVYNREQQELRLRKGLRFINEQIPVTRKLLSQSEVKLDQFRKQHTLIEPAQQATAIAASLSKNEQDQQEIGDRYRAFQAQYQALQKQLGRSSQGALVSSRLSQSERYQTLLNEVQKTELALAQRRVNFTDADPGVQKLLKQRTNQRQLLQSEVRRVLGVVPAQLSSAGKDLQAEGQLGGTDLKVADQLLEAQTNLRILTARKASLAKTEQQLRAQANRLSGVLTEYKRLEPVVEINRDKLEQLLKAQQELSLEIARGGFDWQVLELPQLGEQISPNVSKNLLLGVVVGLMLGGVAAFIREAVDDAIHTSDELKKQVDLPLLGITPELPQARASGPIINVSLGKPQEMEASMIQTVCWPPFRDSLDLIYRNIRFLDSAFSLKSLVVTSALAGEGKTTLALGLAITAARLYQRVLLIDTDLRRPSLHKQLNLPNEQGLSTLLTGDATLPSQSSIQQPGSYIDILTSGPTPADPVKLLSSPRMKELMAVFEQSYDLVLLDAPPVLGIADAIQAASLCSGAILVGRIGRVTRTELMQAAEMLNQSNMVGVVANGTNVPSYSTYSNVLSTEQHENLSFRLYPKLVPAQRATTDNLSN